MKIETHLFKKRDISTEIKPTTAPFIGKWINELGSTLKITFEESNKIKGIYKTAVGDPPPTETFELIGNVVGNAITFLVNFGEKYNSITSWAGEYSIDQGKEKIKTLWHLVMNTPSLDPEKQWNEILAGADEFTKENKENS
jgi:hypothetical protein